MSTARSLRETIPVSMFALAAAISLLLFTAPAAAQGFSIAVDGASEGRRYDGVGAISGGGGTSRLLFDYPAAQQSEILDYLFKPNFGANLQILKVEIGGDTNSTNGAEASHMRSPTDEDYGRGYEWWLMNEAKRRNPNIKLAGLEWGAPGWFNGGIGGQAGFYSQDNIDYILKWIAHAQSDHGLHIDYIGGWNEAGYNPGYTTHRAWFEDLKAALLGNGMTTQLVAYDSTGEDWRIANDLATDPALRDAVDIIGVHYICGNDGGPAITCYNHPPEIDRAISLNKPIWGSEQGSQHWDSGAPALARAINRAYIDARATALINWSAVGSWYRTLPDWGDALMLADEPWSGHYYVGKSIWVMAHTAQFTEPGWRYLDSGSGYPGDDRTHGSFVSLKAPNESDYSIVIETTTATDVQIATILVSGGLSSGTVHVWATNLNSSSPDDWFVQQDDITPSEASYTLTLQPGFLYTVSTSLGGYKGSTTPPLPAGLSLPFSEDFESYPAGSLVRYFAAAQGAFETSPCGGKRNGMCLRQVIDQIPIRWPIGSRTWPLVVFGDPNWTNYQASIDALLEQPGSIDLVGRFQSVNQFGTGSSQGYHLRVTDIGTWTLFKETLGGTDTTLAAGNRPFGLNTWHNLSLSFNGSAIQAFMDSEMVAEASDATFASGQVGLLVSAERMRWQNAQFDNLSVISTGPPGPFTVDDSIQGSGTGQFNYSGDWRHTGCTGDCYNNTNSWDNATNDSVTVAFLGTEIRFYGVKDPAHGIGAVSVDDGEETDIDFYAVPRIGNQLMWTSPTLKAGEHTFKLRVTGTRNPASSNTFVAADRVDIVP
jgi:hypothetical protein